MKFYKIILGDMVFYDIFSDPKKEVEEKIRIIINHNNIPSSFVFYQYQIPLDMVLQPCKNQSSKNKVIKGVLNQDKTISYFNFKRDCFKVKKVKIGEVPENVVEKMRLFKYIESLDKGSVFCFNDYLEIFNLSKEDMFSTVDSAKKYGLLEIVYKINSIYRIVDGEKIINKWDILIPQKATIQTEKGSLNIDLHNILVATRRK